MTVVKLLLVDDHSVMRAGLANMLRSLPDFEIVGEADSSRMALELFKQNRPDVVLLDLSMPGESGLVCLEKLIGEDPQCCAIMLSSSESGWDIHAALERGARGFVFKSAQPSALVEAIHAAKEGRFVLAEEVASRLVSRNEAGLTSRELEVLQLLRKGKSNPDIGKDLKITARTAKAHVAAILEKLNALDRTEAVAIAFERGFLKP
jgi:DNA-binding NarL/FixJ family response regulator